jgi:hypothetical protein
LKQLVLGYSSRNMISRNYFDRRNRMDCGHDGSPGVS